MKLLTTVMYASLLLAMTNLWARGGTATFTATLAPPEASGCAGTAVALGDGWVAVGAPFAAVEGRSEQGNAHVYARNGEGLWLFATSLVDTAGAAYDRFGQALAAQSNRLAVGAWGDGQKGANAGAVHLFETDGTNWFWRCKLTASDGAAGHFFGCAVALDGDRLAVGARKSPVNAKTAAGAVYVFERDANGNWLQRQKLTASDAASYDYFGGAVALDGDDLLAGANDNDDRGPKSGSAYLFRYDRGDTEQWQQTALLLAQDGSEYDLLGSSVALCGGIAALGAPGDAAASGSVCVYARNAGGSNTWGQTAKVMLPDTPAGAAFGSSVVLLEACLIVGAPDSTTAGPLASGCVSLYAPASEGTDWKQTQCLLSETPQESGRFGANLVATKTWLTVGCPGCTTVGVSAGGALLYHLAADAPLFTCIRLIPEAVVVSWMGGTDYTQILERAFTVRAPDWRPILTNPPRTSAMGVYTGALDAAHAYYRLIEIQP